MKSKGLWQPAIALVVIAYMGVAAFAAPAAPPANKWRIECSGAAHSDGTVQLRVTPHQGPAMDVSVTIPKGRAENAVARDIRDALRAQLPKDRFSVETDDGEDVLLKKAGGEPDFSLELVSSSVEHLMLNFDTE